MATPQFQADGRPRSRTPSPPDSFSRTSSFSSTYISTDSNSSPPPSPPSPKPFIAPPSMYSTSASRLRRISPPQTLLGAIDENSGKMLPDVPLSADKESNPVAKLHAYASTVSLEKKPTLASTPRPPPNEFDLLLGPNGEKFTDLRMNRKMDDSRGRGWKKLMCFG